MSIPFLFLAGILAGISISKFKKTDKHGPMVDMMYGMMGSALLGGEIGQFTSTNYIILCIAVIGALLFVKIGRTISI
jgi:uncharacterized membrane protein YeaQ/YmgE (transglycosylase-associated protein family)